MIPDSGGLAYRDVHVSHENRCRLRTSSAEATTSSTEPDTLEHVAIVPTRIEAILSTAPHHASTRLGYMSLRCPFPGKEYNIM